MYHPSLDDRNKVCRWTFVHLYQACCQLDYNWVSYSQVHYVKNKILFKKFIEISKVAYFWKAYSMRNLKINVYICTDAYMAINFQFQNSSQ